MTEKDDPDVYPKPLVYSNTVARL